MVRPGHQHRRPLPARQATFSTSRILPRSTTGSSTGAALFNVPSILKHGDAYVEVAGQSDARRAPPPTAARRTRPRRLRRLRQRQRQRRSRCPSPWRASTTRNFFPLSANVDVTSPGHSAPEFSWSPTANRRPPKPIYAEVVSGGSPERVRHRRARARLDYRFDRYTSVYTWLGRPPSWSEVPGRTMTPPRLQRSPPRAGIHDQRTPPPSRPTSGTGPPGVDLGFASGRDPHQGLDRRAHQRHGHRPC